MKKLNDYKKAKYLLDDKVVEEVYPLSIVEGNQSGDIFVDDIERPTFALFWHYCGFAFIVGECTTNIKEEICDSLNTLKDKHHNRMLIHMANDYELFEEDNIIRGERYIFSFDNQCKRLMVPSDCHICDINNENFDLVRGNIVPSFSWINKEEFLKKGFGFCLMKGQEVLACAFSAGVSEKIVDIGIETNEKHRYVIPKGKTMDGYTQDDMTLLMNHINSTKRKGLQWKSPMELVEQEDEDMQALFKLLKMHLIPADEVHLTPDLFNN